MSVKGQSHQPTEVVRLVSHVGEGSVTPAYEVARLASLGCRLRSLYNATISLLG